MWCHADRSTAAATPGPRGRARRRRRLSPGSVTCQWLPRASLYGFTVASGRAGGGSPSRPERAPPASLQNDAAVCRAGSDSGCGGFEFMTLSLPPRSLSGLLTCQGQMRTSTSRPPHEGTTPCREPRHPCPPPPPTHHSQRQQWRAHFSITDVLVRKRSTNAPPQRLTPRVPRQASSPARLPPLHCMRPVNTLPVATFSARTLSATTVPIHCAQDGVNRGGEGGGLQGRASLGRLCYARHAH